MQISMVSIIIVLACLCSHSAGAAVLPFCSNRTINEVTSRIGCTVGDKKCWLSKEGFCTDYLNKMTVQSGKKANGVWTPVRPVDVRKGDIAIFNSRTHYSYVESVVRDKKGKPVAVNVSEFNFGTCWVDDQAMVTDQYKVRNNRAGVPLASVDGGFWRP